MPLIKKIITMVLVIPSWADAFCFDEAGRTYGIDPRTLRVIAKHESGLNPGVISKNTNGSMDIGLMGINTVHFASGEAFQKMGLTPQMMLDPCTNVQAGAYLLKRKMLKYGPSWDAIGAYHSETPDKAYAYMVRIFNLAKTTP